MCYHLNNLHYKCFIFSVVTLPMGNLDISFPMGGDGKVAFGDGDFEEHLTGFIMGTPDAVIEAIECHTITLTAGDLSGDYALGNIDTAEVCVIDGTGMSA